MTLKKVILTTGGTGGHIFPALAVADELRKQFPNIELLFMGGAGPEKELARKHAVPFLELPAKGIMGKGLAGTLSGMGWFASALPKALRAVYKFKPDAVIGFGGYAGFCPVLAAAILGIPTAVHEQNSVPGMANKSLAKVVKRIFLSFPDTQQVFPAQKATLTGNPVRVSILEAGTQRAHRTAGKRLLILGGSQGARPINDAVIKALPQFMEAGVTLVHQAGKADYQRVRASYETAKADPNQVKDFINDINTEYATADLAICRSGATTVFEIAAAGVPALFVPFPQATHDHQTMNAKAMSDIGAAKLIPQRELTGDALAHAALSLLDDTNQLHNMEQAARGFAKEHAAADIVTGLTALAV